MLVPEYLICISRCLDTQQQAAPCGYGLHYHGDCITMGIASNKKLFEGCLLTLQEIVKPYNSKNG